MNQTKYLFWLLIAIASSSISFAQTSTRKHISFDDDWKFHFGNAADPAKDFNYKITPGFSKSGKADSTAMEIKFVDKNWRTLDLPHDWAVELPFEKSTNFDVMSHGYKPVGPFYPETSIGWYRKHFTIAEKDSGQRFQIQFDGIYRDAKIWINGFYLGNNESGYLGVSYDITDYINYNNDNVVVVRADATQYEGWFYEGAGIYRHVWLNQFNNTNIVKDGVFVHTSVAGKTAKVNVETTVQNQNLLPSNTSVYTYITDRNGKKIGQSKEQPVALRVNENKTIKQAITVADAILWSVESPYLYRLTSIVKSGNQVIDSVQQRFGIRTIAIQNNGVFVNGKHVKIKGVNCHQDHAGVGTAIPDGLQYYRMNLLKEMGVNAYRTSHAAPTPELLDACDSLGILVLDEQRLLNSGPEYINQFERLIKRDRSRASVFLWSIGNEEGYIQGNMIGKRLAQTLVAKQKELDPTRTSTYAADMANVFPGVNEIVSVRGFNYRQFAVADYHKDHPMQPIIGTEMGSTVSTRGIYLKDTVNAYLPDQDITAPWWASTAEAWWPLAAENNFWLGGFIWTGFDYRGEPTPFEWPNISSHFGMMDVCGFPKNIYYYYQSWWADKDVLHISPHWNWKGKEGQPIDVWVNSNANNVELFLNGKSLGKKEMPCNRHLQWSVPYEAGELEAIGYKNGKKVTAKVRTTDRQVAIISTPSKAKMLADGKDVSVINIIVVDEQGQVVPTADNLLSFSIQGDARIISVGNGDPSSHEPDKVLNGTPWQRRLFNGRCQVIVQSAKSAGNIIFTAAGKGLRTAVCNLTTVIDN